MWKVERVLIDWPHDRLPTSDARYHALKKRYCAYRASHDGRKPIAYYSGRETWMPLPPEFLGQGRT